MRHSIDRWLSTFRLHDELHAHVVDVLAALPGEVREDLMDDPCFTMSDYEPGPGVVVQVQFGRPGRRGMASRSVVLKRTLLRRPESFVRYIIAHELAHAHLRNRGRSVGEDPEVAADALADGWGFPKPV
jgi:hypothetical protein